MAEINTATTSDKPGVRRSKKLSTRVDLTPMVDLGFLLITFFIFTTTMSNPVVTKLIMPDDTKPAPPGTVGETSALTVLPIAGNKVFYYHGSMDVALKTGAFGVTGYGMKDGIGQVIRDKQIAMDRIKPDFRKDLTLMIKPDAASNYQNVVDIIDEVKINGLSRYALMDITDEEKQAAATKSGGL
ncbi:ExbD/TolR family protein [Paraflavitalea pollutisoli]|uniref:ExbD/TolR family protein n=1 Tax=Paraflavitalea pollutisoli TaxID=3034143 RepID=UPI0023EA829A|nr:biopolymer transporter ExbD [Paraflavitalea sp. H1-2-19X]